MYKLALGAAGSVGRVAWRVWSTAMTALLFLACATMGWLYWNERRSLDPDLIALMPAPTLFVETGLNPFANKPDLNHSGKMGVFYATGREPASATDSQRFYMNRRGHVLRLGVASIQLGEQPMTWQTLQQIAFSKDRPEEYALRVEKVKEFGILPDSLTPLDDAESLAEQLRGSQDFAEAINQQLAKSERKDIFIYVHGYKVVYENPLLVASELWHYLGYEGAMIAYAWPATPNFAAYFADLETTAYSADDLRKLLKFLAERTDAERINILGYSAGTRLVLDTLDQIALMNSQDSKEDIQDRFKIGRVALVCSDVDRGIFGHKLENGICKVPQQLVVYVSQIDSTLEMSQFFFGRRRLGRLFDDDEIPPAFSQFLKQQRDLHFIDVSAAENAGANNGHAYFHKSPWVSSDLLLSFYSDLEPDERGLLRKNGSPLWEFPTDYPERLRNLELGTKKQNEKASP